MTNFEDWYEELTSDDLWFDRMSYLHSGKPFREAATKVYGEIISNPEANKYKSIQESRTHVHFVLGKMKPTPTKVETNFQQDKTETKLVNLSDEERTRVHSLLDDYLKQLQAGMKKVAPMKAKEIEELGQVEKKLPKSTYHRLPDAKALEEIERHERKRRVRVYWTLKENHPNAEPKQLFQKLNKLLKINYYV